MQYAINDDDDYDGDDDWRNGFWPLNLSASSYTTGRQK